MLISGGWQGWRGRESEELGSLILNSNFLVVADPETVGEEGQVPVRGYEFGTAEHSAEGSAAARVE